VDIICEEFGFYYAGVFLVDESGEWATLSAGRVMPAGDDGRWPQAAYWREFDDWHGNCQSPGRIALDVVRRLSFSKTRICH